MRRIFILLLSTILSLSAHSQSIVARLDITSEPIKQLHISEDGKNWVLTTDSKIILWNDEEKKVKWSVDHAAYVYNKSYGGYMYPSKAVVSGDKIFQVNGRTVQLDVRKIEDGSIEQSAKLNYPTTYNNKPVEGYLLPTNIIELPKANKFLAIGKIEYDTTYTIGTAQFLPKKLDLRTISYAPGSNFAVARNTYWKSNRAATEHTIYSLDPALVTNPARSIRPRYQEKLTGAVLPSRDGKHVYRAWESKRVNYKPVFEVEKIFGLTKKALSSFTIENEPRFFEFLGSESKLVLFSKTDQSFEWHSIDIESWKQTKVPLSIASPAALFNDPKRNQLIVAEESGSLWIIVPGSEQSAIVTYNSVGEQQEETKEDLVKAAAAADREAAIRAIRKDPTDPKTNPQYYDNKAAEFSGKGMHAAAEATQQRLLEVFKDDYFTVAYMGWYKLLNNKLEEAQEFAIKAHQMIPFDGIAPTIISYTYAIQDNLTEAKRFMKIAVGKAIENQDLTPIDSDIETLGSIGYSTSSLQELNVYYGSLYKSELNQRANNLATFQQAQQTQSVSSRLNQFETVIRNENQLAAPRPELLGAAYSEAANALRDKGNIEKAEEYGLKAVEVLRAHGKYILLVGGLVNAGHAHNAGGKEDQAIRFYNEALEFINEYGGDFELYKDGAINGLGGAYQDIGEYNRAITYYEQALELSKKSGRRVDQGIAMANLATVYVDQGNDLNGALNLLKQAEAIFRQAGDREALARNHNNLGFAYQLLGQLRLAVDAFRDADRIFTALGMNSETANTNKNIGKMLLMLDRKIEAISYYKKAAGQVNEDEDLSMAMSIYANLAGAELGQEQYSQSAQHASKAIELNEKLVTTSTGKTKRGLLSKTNNYYRILSLSRFRQGNFKQAFEAHEQNRSRVMLEKLGGGTPTTTSAVQASLKSNQALIDYSVVHLFWEIHSHLFPIVITQNSIRGKEYSDSTLIVDLKQEGESTFVAYMRQRTALQKIKQFVEEKGVPDNVAQSLIRESNLEKTIEFYRHLIKDPKVTNEVLRKSYAKVFYQLLIGNIKDQLVGKDELIIIPDGPLAFLPFETLIDDNGKYLAETYKIKYIQSATILDKLSQRNYASTRKPLLAFGGPTFEEMGSEEVSKYRGSAGGLDFRDLQETYYAAEEAGGSMRPTYIKMGFTKMTPLPGTIYETNQIKSIVQGSDLYQSDQASENQFKSLANSDVLKNYKVLHFATHGWAYGEIPELSTLVLGQYATPRGEEDGYLRVPEIEKLNLNADFVNLSACETALGKLYSSEGVVGLTQAFLVAGAKGISVTQWTVSDEGTAIFMSEMYRKVFTQNQSFQDAIAATKVEFIQGKYGEKFKHPDYWGPFVYYGI